jgi:hypothetical protein
MFRSEIYKLLSSFVPIGLNEMDDVSLMNRIETKYVFSANKLPDLLNLFSNSYRILDIDLIRIFPYHTTYLDTSDLLFFTQQLRGKLNRHKVRYRCYESTGLSFLEIKKRTNKNRTIKWRIESRLNTDPPDENATAFFKEYLPHDYRELNPVLINQFSRITLVGSNAKERVTLDYDIAFTSPDGRIAELPFLAVAELKRDKDSGKSPFGIIMKQHGLRPNRFSKYCIGSALTTDIIRKNSIKPNLLLINKIKNEYTMFT